MLFKKIQFCIKYWRLAGRSNIKSQGGDLDLFIWIFLIVIKGISFL